MKRVRLKREDDRNEPGPVEKGTMVVSTLLVAGVLGYMLWQAVALPEKAEPAVEVESIGPGSSGDVHVQVRIVNDAAAGLRDITVEVDCDDPPPSVQVSNVPARGERWAILACPEGTTQANATIASIIHA